MRVNTKKVEGTAEIIGTLIINGFKAGYEDQSESATITLNGQDFIDLNDMDIKIITVDDLVRSANKFVESLASNKSNEVQAINFNDAFEKF